MSSAAIIWARQQKLGKPHLKSLLNAIATRANNEGVTFASQATLADDLGLTDRQIRKSLALLETLGVIVRNSRSRGRKGRMSDNIILSTHRTFDVSGADLRRAGQARDAAGATVPVGEANTSGTLLPPASKTPTGTVGSLQPEPEFQGLNSDETVPSQEEGISEVEVGGYTRGQQRRLQAAIIPFGRRAQA